MRIVFTRKVGEQKSWFHKRVLYVFLIFSCCGFSKLKGTCVEEEEDSRGFTQGDRLLQRKARGQFSHAFLRTQFSSPTTPVKPIHSFSPSASSHTAVASSAARNLMAVRSLLGKKTAPGAVNPPVSEEQKHARVHQHHRTHTDILTNYALTALHPYPLYPFVVQ